MMLRALCLQPFPLPLVWADLQETHFVTAFMLFRNLKFVFLDAHLSKTAFLAHCSKNADQRKKECSSESKICSLQYKNISIEWWQYFYSLNFSQKKRCLSIFGFVHLARRVSQKASKARCCRSPPYSWHGGTGLWPNPAPDLRCHKSGAHLYMIIYADTHTHICALGPQDPPFLTKEWLSKEDLNMLFCKMIPSYTKV